MISKRLCDDTANAHVSINAFHLISIHFIRKYVYRTYCHRFSYLHFVAIIVTNVHPMHLYLRTHVYTNKRFYHSKKKKRHVLSIFLDKIAIIQQNMTTKRHNNNSNSKDNKFKLREKAIEY